MSFLRFTRPEYQAIAAVCRPLNLERCTPNILRQVLVRSLGPEMAELARRIGGLSGQQLRLLHDHLRQHQRPSIRSDFTATEFSRLVDVFGSLLHTVRFVRPLKRPLVEHFQSIWPELAVKLEQLSYTEFEELCDEVQKQTQRDRLR